jgi:hypothetical protein
MNSCLAKSYFLFRIPTFRNVLSSLCALVLAVSSVIAAHAQSAPLPIGTATIDLDPATCSPSDGWLSGGTCTHYQITGCANARDLGVTINYVPASPSAGTIVFFSGGAGTSATTPSGPGINLCLRL